MYWPGTNILITRFLSPDGVGEVNDYMPVGKADSGTTTHRLVRRVTTVRGTMQYRMECYPGFNYARDAHTTDIEAEGGCFNSPSYITCP